MATLFNQRWYAFFGLTLFLICGKTVLAEESAPVSQPGSETSARGDDFRERIRADEFDLLETFEPVLEEPLGCSAWLTSEILGGVYDLACDCKPTGVGYELGPYYPSKKDCDAKTPKKKVYDATLTAAHGFCHRVFKCTHKDCQIKRHVPLLQNKACACKRLTGHEKETWAYVCDMLDSDCCCAPDL